MIHKISTVDYKPVDYYVIRYLIHQAFFGWLYVSYVFTKLNIKKYLQILNSNRKRLDLI